MRTVNTSEVELLVGAAAAGDEHAWNALVDEFAGLVWTVARSFRLDDAAAADVVQECWRKLVTNIETIREPARIASWLTTTAKHEALRVVGVRNREQPTEIDDERAQGHDGPVDEALIDEEQNKQLYDALARMDEKDERFLRLFLAEPKIPYEDIAEIAGIAVGSIGATRRRCLDKLRHILEANGIER